MYCLKTVSSSPARGEKSRLMYLIRPHTGSRRCSCCSLHSTEGGRPANVQESFSLQNCGSGFLAHECTTVSTMSKKKCPPQPPSDAEFYLVWPFITAPGPMINPALWVGYSFSRPAGQINQIFHLWKSSGLNA